MLMRATVCKRSLTSKRQATRMKIESWIGFSSLQEDTRSPCLTGRRFFVLKNEHRNDYQPRKMQKLKFPELFDCGCFFSKPRVEESASTILYPYAPESD